MMEKTELVKDFIAVMCVLKFDKDVHLPAW
jgi:hypothetical protein